MSAHYRPLVPNTRSYKDSEDFEKEHIDDLHIIHKPTPQRAGWSAAFIVSVLLNFIFMITILLVYRKQTPLSAPLRYIPWIGAQPIDSPAQEVVRYERRTFTELGVRTIYHGPPTDETDRAWDALYPVGMTRIPNEDAAKMANWTERIAGDESHSLVVLEVYHQLHCLNHLRKALSPERYGHMHLGEPILEGDPTPFDHTDHCINILRESVMCTVDITPNVFQWSDLKRQVWPHFDSVHTCRNFDAINEWAAGHALLEPFNKKLRVPPGYPF
ncbi:hypothetical protein SISSUDRAFT_1034870 [Sistotremastrum suecicum HHB10207 ss-3]|uniref:Tat pathway signal sequence n=1 Tax=Sistotremastrum suecicum HHB10207 ss-3 TaxID=1314776 RepID=A0A166BID9_9AGAM|nr:hypothetical protein SISSUDRAFT_1034870 [Sistotremastrum suecicum HHB10207 ss-3]